MVTITRPTAVVSAEFAFDTAVTALAASEWTHSGQLHAFLESHLSIVQGKRGSLSEEIHREQNEVEQRSEELKDLGGSSWDEFVGAMFGADTGVAAATPITAVRESVAQPTDQSQVNGSTGSERLYAKPDWPGIRAG